MTMASFDMEEILSMQRALQEKYKDRWEPIGPATGQNKLLWMIGEIGEVIDVIKKDEIEKTLADPSARAHLAEELADVLMYFGDVLLCYGISAGELKDTYTKKFERNMKRW